MPPAEAAEEWRRGLSKHFKSVTAMLNSRGTQHLVRRLEPSLVNLARNNLFQILHIFSESKQIDVARQRFPGEHPPQQVRFRSQQWRMLAHEFTRLSMCHACFTLDTKGVRVPVSVGPFASPCKYGLLRVSLFLSILLHNRSTLHRVPVLRRCVTNLSQDGYVRRCFPVQTRPASHCMRQALRPLTSRVDWGHTEGDNARLVHCERGLKRCRVEALDPDCSDQGCGASCRERATTAASRCHKSNPKI